MGIHSVADLDLLNERFELASSAARRGGRGIAVLAVKIHSPTGARSTAADVPEDLQFAAEARVARCLRRVDTFAKVEPLRYAVLLERAEEGPFAVHVADRLVSELRRPWSANGEPLELVASVGISLFPSDGEDVVDLIECADSALEAAELSGGNVFGFYSAPMSERAGRRVAIERALVGLLDRNELELHYQPQVDTRDGTLAGVEALLRWQNDKLGQVSPAEFVPLLEHTGAIERVGDWVIREACAQGAEWARNQRPVRVGVNVSAQQLRSRRFESTVQDALSSSGLPPSLLELELTEGVLVENPAFTRELLDSLRRQGVKVAVDDFGTGYASLAYIRQFPMDTLKIDRQFVRGLPVDAESAAITSAIVALGRSLRLAIVAEGVETEAAEEFLHSLDCFVVQGYRHARPMNLRDFAEWRRTRPWT